MHSGYGRLVELAERELELVRAERLEELPALWGERRGVVTELPYVPPLDARDCLARAADLQGQTTALLEERLAATGAEMRRVVLGRSAMQGYSVPLARIPLVDRAG
jgi:ABC-type transporter lipoprotein component MlaA